MTREDLLILALMWTWAWGAQIVRGIMLDTVRTKVQRRNWMIGAFIALASATWPLSVPILACFDLFGFYSRGRR